MSKTNRDLSQNEGNNMSYLKIWIHLAWSTKKRNLLITGNIKKPLINHILENAHSKEIYIDSINGMADHIHILISLSTSQTISKIVQLIKGESSNWINRNKMTDQKFQWQENYFAVSVSESFVQKVRNYIKNQKSHHQRLPYSAEYDEFISKYNFDKG